MNYSTFVCLCTLLVACYESTNPLIDAGPGPRRDGAVGSDSSMRDVAFRDTAASDVAIDSGPPVRVEQVDMLFMIDNSRSMVEEQASLAAELPNIVRILASGESSDRPFPAIVDLRVGFVTSDMGTGGYTIPTCNEQNFGDDGVLHRGADCGVAAGSPPYIGLRPGDGDDINGFADAAACLAQLGTEGCGFEQQLEAVLKALTPNDGTFLSGEPVTFLRGSRGHGNGINESFVRDGSLLVVVVLTDEDDCSASSDAIFSASPEASAEFGPVRDPRMLERPDPAIPSQLTPSCSVVGRGDAFPAVRLVRVAQGLHRRGADVSVQSICQDDYGPLLDHIIDHL